MSTDGHNTLPPRCSTLPSSWIWYTILFEVVLWNFLILLFCKISSRYKASSDERKNKVVTYLFGFLIRGSTLIFCIYVAIHYVDSNLNMRLDKMDCFSLYSAWLSAVAWATSFVIELCVLKTLGWDLWLHHIIVIVSVARFVDGSSGAHADVIYAGLIWVISLGGSAFVCHQMPMVIYHWYHDNVNIGYYCMLFRVYEQSIFSSSIFGVVAFYQYGINFHDSDAVDKVYNLCVLILNAIIEVYVVSILYKIMKKKQGQRITDFIISKQGGKTANNSIANIELPNYKDGTTDNIAI